jgi:hypothetical protein
MNATQGAPLPGPQAEHGALLRAYAAAQRRVSATLAEQARREQRLEAQLLRLRGDVLRWHTQCAWAVPVEPSRRPSDAVWAQAQAAALLCQTGCLPFDRGRADGETCRRTGQPCAAPTPETIRSAQPPTAG